MLRVSNNIIINMDLCLRVFRRERRSIHIPVDGFKSNLTVPLCSSLCLALSHCMYASVSLLPQVLSHCRLLLSLNRLIVHITVCLCECMPRSMCVSPSVIIFQSQQFHEYCIENTTCSGASCFKYTTEN